MPANNDSGYPGHIAESCPVLKRCLFSIKVFSNIQNKYMEMTCLIDSGASENFIDETLANNLHLPKYPLKIPIPLETITGDPLLKSPISFFFPQTQILINEKHTEKYCKSKCRLPIPICTTISAELSDEENSIAFNSSSNSSESEEFFDTVEDQKTLNEDYQSQPSTPTIPESKSIDEVINPHTEPIHNEQILHNFLPDQTQPQPETPPNLTPWDRANRKSLQKWTLRELNPRPRTYQALALTTKPSIQPCPGIEPRLMRSQPSDETTRLNIHV
ncbi:hypothetical protein BB559_000307 [Furculomyces boomerangus]|uniref:Uncharacterized protein n=1 Tax=Furculomyces boomerangus TaxID=61424 RepID=A0A2T9Z5L1_9FUNG|nr:hypothetical protein BB559_006469 [Furculomyces boomerangus]PVU99880.1 hypothetical protein BB559_000307 [Furculomyces boomerangus]